MQPCLTQSSGSRLSPSVPCGLFGPGSVTGAGNGTIACGASALKMEKGRVGRGVWTGLCAVGDSAAAGSTNRTIPNVSKTALAVLIFWDPALQSALDRLAAADLLTPRAARREEAHIRRRRGQPGGEATLPECVLTTGARARRPPLLRSGADAPPCVGPRPEDPAPFVAATNFRTRPCSPRVQSSLRRRGRRPR